MFEYLVPVGGTFLEGLRGCGLVEGGVSVRVGFQVSKDLFYSLPPTADQDVNAQIFLQQCLCSALMYSVT